MNLVVCKKITEVRFHIFCSKFAFPHNFTFSTNIPSLRYEPFNWKGEEAQGAA